MWGYSLQLTFVALAISLVSCTVPPVLVFAEDTVTITNVARSSVSTGGQDGADGQNGANGTDGRTGINGADGSDGKAGVSITNNAFGSTIETVKIETVGNGEAVVTYDGVSQSAVGLEASVSGIASGTAAESNEVSAPSAEDVPTKSPLAQLFVDLQLIIFTYVSYLF